MADGVRDFHTLLQQVREGCPEAIREFTELYSPVLQRFIRRRLDPKLRSKFDSLDFVQDVWASFFANPMPEERFAEAQSLARFLLALARNKMIDTGRLRLSGLKYQIAREESLERAEELPAPDQPTPSQFVAAKETWEQLLAVLPPHHRRIVKLLRQGHSPEETACVLGLTSRTVYRVLRKVVGEGLP